MFWIFLAVFWACETYLYSKGHNTCLFTHKTPAEKEIRKQQIKPTVGTDEETGCL